MCRRLEAAQMGEQAQASPRLSYNDGRTSMRKRLIQVAVAAGVLYGLLVAGLFWAMYQPPAVFGRIMSKTPPVAYLVLPFRRLWLVARRGQLHTGDLAPDFSLSTPDGSTQVRLSSFRGHKPVVLIFGSHT
jgi:hypothetical protein